MHDLDLVAETASYDDSFQGDAENGHITSGCDEPRGCFIATDAANPFLVAYQRGA